MASKLSVEKHMYPWVTKSKAIRLSRHPVFNSRRDPWLQNVLYGDDKILEKLSLKIPLRQHDRQTVILYKSFFHLWAFWKKRSSQEVRNEPNGDTQTEDLFPVILEHVIQDVGFSSLFAGNLPCSLVPDTGQDCAASSRFTSSSLYSGRLVHHAAFFGWGEPGESSPAPLMHHTTTIPCPSIIINPRWLTVGQHANGTTQICNTKP